MKAAESCPVAGGEKPAEALVQQAGRASSRGTGELLAKNTWFWGLGGGGLAGLGAGSSGLTKAGIA